MIQTTSLSKKYGTNTAISNLNLHIKRGEFVFLTGHSGAGKSTLLNLMSHTETPTSGDITINGHSVKNIDSTALTYHKRNMGIVFQEHYLLFDRSIIDNVSLPLQVAGFGRSYSRNCALAALDKVGMRDKSYIPPKQLSRGEQQRVSIARAIVHNPILLIADEPMGHLDIDLSCRIADLLYKCNSQDTTVVIATHDTNIISRYNCREIAIKEGKLVKNIIHKHDV